MQNQAQRRRTLQNQAQRRRTLQNQAQSRTLQNQAQRRRTCRTRLRGEPCRTRLRGGEPAEPGSEEENLQNQAQRWWLPAVPVGVSECGAGGPGPDQSQVGCRELRSTKYISDGQCTSVSPIKELVCAGECLPNHLLPNWIGGGGGGGRYWSRRDAQEWRCVIDRTRTQRIRLQCHDGSARTYRITVVTSCKCKRHSRQQNESGHKIGKNS
uniref:Sclerostin domain containing 1b n=1 Tax=Salarias fasciatus TaxID=181472 RepID=A0A672GN42_SALFA